MRPIIVAAVGLAATMLLPTTASAFEFDSAGTSATGSPNFDFDVDEDAPTTSTVLERFSDADDTSKPGKLQVFGNNLPGYGNPNYIPEPPRETPGWFYSTPAFRSVR